MEASKFSVCFALYLSKVVLPIGFGSKYNKLSELMITLALIESFIIINLKDITTINKYFSIFG